MAGAAAGRVADAEDSGHLPSRPSLCETMLKLFSVVDFPLRLPGFAVFADVLLPIFFLGEGFAR